MDAVPHRLALLEDRSLVGRNFCDAHTKLIDSWLAALFQSRDSAASPAPLGVALVALGGHGRGELAPQSDLDLMLIAKRRESLGDAEILAERIWYPIWDSGLQLGHSVRTLKEALALASDDLETATALLSARHISGDQALSEELVERARVAWRRNGRRWLGVLADSVEARHVSEGDIAFSLEPDLKEGRGGLRDIHALTWATMAGAEVRRDSADASAAAYDVLLGVRVELHRVTERHGDRLLLQEQDPVASFSGDADADGLMERVAAAGRQIAWWSDECWFDIHRTLVGSPRLRRRPADRPLGGAVAVRDSRVALSDEVNPVSDPATVLRVALGASLQHTRISARTLDLLKVAPELPEPWDGTSRQLMCDLLMCGSSSIAVIEALDHSGLWERLIREWRAVRSLPQRNPLHRYTVDRHLLECSARAADLVATTPRPDLLVMGALLHDIGKGYPGDHSHTGELLAAGIARRMGFTPGDADTIGFLARHHLLLVEAATRRDLSDPATIDRVAGVVETSERLALLRSLTEADARATGMGTWNTWTEALVDELASRVRVRLDVPGSMSALSLWQRDGLDASLISQAEIDEHQPQSSGFPLVRADEDRLSVVCADRRGVICRVAGVLALHGLGVVEATATSESGLAVDEFRVRSTASDMIPWDRIVGDVELALRGRLAIEARLAERIRTHRRRYPAGLSQMDPEVRFDTPDGSASTIIETVGVDRAGLLYQLTRAMSEFDLNIRSAKIHTVGVDAVDTFYVTDSDSAPLEDSDLQSEIRRGLMNVLTGAI